MRELADKKGQIQKLDAEIANKRKEANKPGMTSDAAANKLEYFEGEVRRLESKLTQQKVSYERQIKSL